ncbi:MAG TPA: hypothetical protein PK200_06095 [Spirochaetota bacterium]|nr:hypothetical protein [Spirochaetota bacterium]
MKNRITNISLTYGLDLLLILIILGIAMPLTFYGLGGPYLIVFFVILLMSILPVFNYIHGIVNSTISPARYEDLFARTVDSILNINAFNQFLKETFDQIIALTKARNGLLIFYYPETDQYSIFYQKNRRSRVIKNANIESSNALFRAIEGPDNIIIRNNLDMSINSHREIAAELNKINGEIVVPIYFQEIFLGLVVIGSRKKKFSTREIDLLKIFASKIAVLSINSFFFHELLKKKEIEKEQELASKIHHRFFPGHDIAVGKIQVRVHHRTNSLQTREFYDVFVNEKNPEAVRISSYQIHSDITGTSIYMPGIQALLQCYARLGYSTAKTIKKLNAMLNERELFDEDIAIFHSSLDQKGKFEYCNSGYPEPFLFRISGGQPRRLNSPKKGAAEHIQLRTGDTVIICCEGFAPVINEQKDKIHDLLKQHRESSAGKARSAIIKLITPLPLMPEKDMLLILIRMESGS